MVLWDQIYHPGFHHVALSVQTWTEKEDGREVASLKSPPGPSQDAGEVWGADETLQEVLLLLLFISLDQF